MTNQNNEVTYSIGELAKEFDITPRSIRFYEEQDLLSPERTGQARIYCNKDRVRLKLILRGKRLGFSLAEVNNLFELYDTNPDSAIQLETMLSMTEQKRAVLRQQLEDIQMLMGELDEVEAVVLTLDGVGEWATTTVAIGKGSRFPLVISTSTNAFAELLKINKQKTNKSIFFISSF